MRTARVLVLVGGTAVLAALPPQDLARVYDGAVAVGRKASAFTREQFARWSGPAGDPSNAAKPLAPSPQTTATLPTQSTTQAASADMQVPVPRLAVRTGLVSEEAKRQLDQVRMPPPLPAPTDATKPAATELQKAAVEPAALTAPAPVAVSTTAQQAATPAMGPRTEAQPAAIVAPPPALAPAPAASGIAVTTEPPKPVAISPVENDVDAKTASADAATTDKKAMVAARLLFGSAKSAAPLAARSIGYYSRGCLSGAKALPVDGKGWQAMRLSRNRNWGHPVLVALIERFAGEVQKEDGWPGLLVGDMSQPRGGPMLTGHSSHQIGLDADIWFTPMPNRTLSQREREDISATSMIDGPLKVDATAFTPNHVKVVKRAASYRQVERVLVHPAIKKALCEAAGKDRAWLSKVRPYFGHHYHFHVRIACPKGSGNCRVQDRPRNDDGCGKELDDWFKLLTQPPKPHPPGYKPPPPRPPLTLADLPQECRVVLTSGDSEVVKDEAEMVRTSIERSKTFIDISGKKRTQ